MLKKFLLLLALLAAAASGSHAADELDGLDQTIQVLDDAGTLEGILSAMPAPQELPRDRESDAPVGVAPASHQGFDSDFVIEEDEMLTEDDFEQGEDIDDDRYDDV